VADSCQAIKGRDSNFREHQKSKPDASSIGDTVEVEVTPRNFGRMLHTRMRKEQAMMPANSPGRKGKDLRGVQRSCWPNEFVSGTVRRFDRPMSFSTLEIEAIRPQRERAGLVVEDYNVGGPAPRLRGRGGKRHSRPPRYRFE